MTESDDLHEGSEERTTTALLILHPVGDERVTDMQDARDQLIAALVQLGFLCGPVVGDVCAVTGPPDHIAALEDHVAVMHHPAPVEGANQEFLAMLRPVVDQLVFDDPVEPFPDQVPDQAPDLSTDTAPSRTERTHPDDDVQHPTPGEPPLDNPPA